MVCVFFFLLTLQSEMLRTAHSLFQAFIVLIMIGSSFDIFSPFLQSLFNIVLKAFKVTVHPNVRLTDVCFLLKIIKLNDNGPLMLKALQTQQQCLLR